MTTAELFRTIPSFEGNLRKRHDTLLNAWCARHRAIPSPERREALYVEAERALTAETWARLHSEDVRLRSMLGGSRRGDALLEHAQILRDVLEIRLMADPVLVDNAQADLKHREVVISGRGEFDDELYSDVVHEAGHNLAGLAEPCRGGFHYRARDRKSGCLWCEYLAWQVGREHLAITWSAAMHRHMAKALGLYTRATPGPPEAFAAIAELTSDASFRAETERRRQWETRRTLVTRWQREGALRRQA